MTGESPSETERSDAALTEDRARRVYLAYVRHELCTPINAILGYSEILTEEAREADREEVVPDLRKIGTAAENLQALVDHLLDPHNIEKVTVGNADLDAVAATIRHDLRTPLNAILGYAEMLIEEVEEGGAAPVADLLPDLQKLHAAAKRLLTLINDIVRLSGFETAGDAERREIVPSGEAFLVHEAFSFIRSWGEAAVGMTPEVGQGRLLVVDDNEINRDVLSRQLQRQGHAVVATDGGAPALDRLAAQSFDLVLLDILMPEMNGYQVLERLKADPALRDIPVIMISALDELDSVVRCIEMGAEDYLPKPFNPVLLKARIGACLEKKRLRDREKAYVEQLRIEREKSEHLLLNVLPRPIAERLKERAGIIADSFDEATVLFADLVGFTEFSADMPPADLVHLLNQVFTLFDDLAEQHDLQKIKTIGDSYMVAAGIPMPRADHTEAMVEIALAMLQALEDFNRRTPARLEVRIGIHTGPVVAGVIGTKRFIYDLWGDTVNTASRMESHGVPGRIHVTEAVASRLRGRYLLEERRKTRIRSKGEMITYFVAARQPS